MQASDVIRRLAERLPFYTNAFSDSVAVSSLSMIGNIATAVTASAHGFSVGKGVCITNAATPITISSFTRVGTKGTIVTATDHDATLKVPGVLSTEGATEAAFNGSFTVSAVPNRRTIEVVMADTGALTATGAPVVLNASPYNRQYNGWFEILSTPTPTTFTMALGVSGLPNAKGSVVAHSNLRVTGLASAEDIESVYTEQAPTKQWMFVVLGDTISSKDRNNQADSVSNVQRQQHYRQQIIQALSIYTVLPTAEQEIAGRIARDMAETVFSSICQSILFNRFPTGLHVDYKNPLQFVSHGFEAYNGAYYIHNYNFEQTADLQFEDTVGYSEDIALRSIYLDMMIQGGTEIFSAEINLDQVPV